ncbi:MAG: OadG family protein [Bacteroidales bacterium]|nr:OadG family protein [Bacteroidales bacterium]
MEKISIGLELMGIGMVTVFAILLIVIFGSRLLITIINRIAPEESKPEKAAPAADDTAAVRPVLDAAVAQLTGGKGHIVKITKIS